MRGEAGRGRARQGEAGRGRARPGEAGRGTARHGEARRGTARHGERRGFTVRVGMRALCLAPHSQLLFSPCRVVDRVWLHTDDKQAFSEALPVARLLEDTVELVHVPHLQRKSRWGRFVGKCSTRLHASEWCSRRMHAGACACPSRECASRAHLPPHPFLPLYPPPCLCVPVSDRPAQSLGAVQVHATSHPSAAPSVPCGTSGPVAQRAPNRSRLQAASGREPHQHPGRCTGVAWLTLRG